MVLVRRSTGPIQTLLNGLMAKANTDQPLRIIPKGPLRTQMDVFNILIGYLGMTLADNF